MTRLEAQEKIDKWWDSLSIVTDEEFYDFYEVYWEKLESIDDQCEGFGDFEDVPNLHL